MGSNDPKASAGKPGKRGPSRPSHVLAAEKVAGLGIDQLQLFVTELASKSPATAAYVSERLSAAMKAS
jgi:hypothetical protein